jgi:hypothetical protein
MLFALGVVLAIKTASFILLALYEALLSPEGILKVLDSLFYGMLVVLLLHYTGILPQVFNNHGLIISWTMVVLLKPIEKIIVNLAKEPR